MLDETGLWQRRYAPSEINTLLGQWTVEVSNCVDRREEALGTIDCSLEEASTVTLELVAIIPEPVEDDEEVTPEEPDEE